MMYERINHENQKTRLERVLLCKSYDEVIQMMISGEVRQYDVLDDYEINKIVAKRLKRAPEQIAAYRAVIDQRRRQEAENALEELPKLVAVFFGGAM